MRGLAEPGSSGRAAPCGCAQPALETGNVLTEPIGYLESCFSAKNGTPRQPSICSHSRACLKIRKSIFNNPEHSLMGLEQFSHVWILFVFHKNGHLNYKAKVQPPRLNGAKTGVFSTRSPHRPNAIGLTLAKLEKVEGGAVYLSGIDMIHGTPVLDIKPYIADYDSPQNLEPLEDFNKLRAASQADGAADSCDQHLLSGCGKAQHCHSAEEKLEYLEDRTPEENSQKSGDSTDTQHILPEDRERTVDLVLGSSRGDSVGLAEEQLGQRDLKSFLNEGKDGSRNVDHALVLQRSSAETRRVSCHVRTADSASCSVVPTWVKEAPAASLQVRFTPHAEMDLRKLSSGDAGRMSFKYFRSTEEARGAIEDVLSADPRSVYRRQLCQDRLFFFTVDTAHVTCWFGDGFAEVVRIKLTSGPVEMTDPEESLVALGSGAPSAEDSQSAAVGEYLETAVTPAVGECLDTPVTPAVGEGLETPVTPAVGEGLDTPVTPAVGECLETPVTPAVGECLETVVTPAVGECLDTPVTPAVGECLDTPVTPAVGECLDTPVTPAVGEFLDTPVTPAVGECLETPVTAAVGECLDTPVTPAVGECLETPVTPAVGECLDTPVTPAVGEGLETPVTPAVGEGLDTPVTPAVGECLETPVTPAVGECLETVVTPAVGECLDTPVTPAVGECLDTPVTPAVGECLETPVTPAVVGLRWSTHRFSPETLAGFQAV
ncbi:hypothetical protein STEG23_037361 [Scotinomys teguina]